MTSELGNRIRQLRIRACLTQEQLAERTTVSVSTIRRLETGKLTDHRLSTLRLLAEALDVETEEWQRLTALLDRTQSVPVGQPPSAGESAPAVRQTPRAEAPAPARAELRHVSAPATPSPGGAIGDAAESLAREIARRLQREEKHRRLHDPFPLPVRYEPAPVDLMDHPENIQRLPPEAPNRDLDLNGDLRTLADTYRTIESQRLVVLGRAGSGKSVLAIKFALELFAAPRPSLRVPVILGIGSWDPLTVTPRDLLVDHLLRDHPHLARTTPEGTTLAAELVDSDLILPLLDGFDELAEPLRGPALRALNETSHPLVLTSRRNEYAWAVKNSSTPLVLAACIELADLSVEDLAAYLPRTDRRSSSLGSAGAAGGWGAVLETLRSPGTTAGSQLRQALGTPLMVTLARTIYSDVPGNKPAELLDTARFPTAREIEEHLLANFVPTVYRRRTPERSVPAPRQPNRDPDRAERWLGYLAHSLTTEGHEELDLAWWRLGASVRTPTRILHTALLGGLCMFVANWLVVLIAVLVGYIPSLDKTVALTVAVFGLNSAFTFGIAHCVLAALRRAVAVPTQVRLRFAAVDPGVRHRPIREMLTRFGVGFLGGAMLGVGHTWTTALARVLAGTLPYADVIDAAIQDMLAIPVIFGLTAGLAFGLVAAFEVPVDTTAAATPMRLLSVNRGTAIRQSLVIATVVTVGLALCGAVVVHLLQPILPWKMAWVTKEALVLGAVGGLGGSVVYAMVFTAWGQWLTVARFWLPLTRKLPWDTAAFLNDAYRRGVLRQAGAVYQFRHIRLQQHLARSYREPDQAPDM